MSSSSVENGNSSASSAGPDVSDQLMNWVVEVSGDTLTKARIFS